MAGNCVPTADLDFNELNDIVSSVCNFHVSKDNPTYSAGEKANLLDQLQGCKDRVDRDIEKLREHVEKTRVETERLKKANMQLETETEVMNTNNKDLEKQNVVVHVNFRALAQNVYNLAEQDRNNKLMHLDQLMETINEMIEQNNALHDELSVVGVE